MLGAILRLVEKVEEIITMELCAYRIRAAIQSGRCVLVVGAGAQEKLLASTFSYGFLKALETANRKLLVLDFSECGDSRELKLLKCLAEWKPLQKDLDIEEIRWLAATTQKEIVIAVILSPKGKGAKTFSHLVKTHHLYSWPFSTVGFTGNSLETLG